MDPDPFRADCARCAALCCVALAFDRSPLFAYDKRAGEPCRHLDEGDRCGIHADRSAHGFAGCARYDCLGAGQFVSQALFNGRSWRAEPDLLRPMMAAFADIRAAHEMVLMLRAARALPWPKAQRRRLGRLQRRLTPEAGWTRADVSSGRIGAIVDDVRAFIASLRAGRGSNRRLWLWEAGLKVSESQPGSDHEAQHPHQSSPSPHAVRRRRAGGL